MAKIGSEKVEKLLSLSHLRVLPCLRVKGTIEMGQQTLREELAKLNSERGLSVEVDEINNTPPEKWHERDFSRLGMANNAKQRTTQKPTQRNKSQLSYLLGLALTYKARCYGVWRFLLCSLKRELAHVTVCGGLWFPC